MRHIVADRGGARGDRPAKARGHQPGAIGRLPQRVRLDIARIPIFGCAAGRGGIEAVIAEDAVA